METTIKHPTAQVFVREAKTKTANRTESISAYDKWIEKLNFSYFGIIAMTITIGSMLGGFAAMSIHAVDAPIWQLALCMSVSMANNVACIGQASTKWVVNIFFLTVIVNTLLIIVNVM
jgi:hypothetical protein